MTKCPKCGATMVANISGFGGSLTCPNLCTIPPERGLVAMPDVGGDAVPTESRVFVEEVREAMPLTAAAGPPAAPEPAVAPAAEPEPTTAAEPEPEPEPAAVPANPPAAPAAEPVPANPPAAPAARAPADKAEAGHPRITPPMTPVVKK